MRAPPLQAYMAITRGITGSSHHRFWLRPPPSRVFGANVRPVEKNKHLCAEQFNVLLRTKIKNKTEMVPGRGPLFQRCRFERCARCAKWPRRESRSVSRSSRPRFSMVWSMETPLQKVCEVREVFSVRFARCAIGAPRPRFSIIFGAEVPR